MPSEAEVRAEMERRATEAQQAKEKALHQAMQSALAGRKISTVSCQSVIDLGGGVMRLSGEVRVQLEGGAVIVQDPLDFRVG